MAEREDRRKKGGFMSILRSVSLTRKPKAKDNRRSSSIEPGLNRRASTSSRPEPSADAPSRRRSYHTESFNPAQSRSGRTKDKNKGLGVRNSSGRLQRWPPPGMTNDDVLTERKAQLLIGRGASTHKGFKKAIPHSDDVFFQCYSSSSCKSSSLTGLANNKEMMAEMQSMVLQGVNPDNRWSPWDTVEQPSYTFYHGYLPGTISLNQWAWGASKIPERIQLRKSPIEVRDVDLIDILQRLDRLQDIAVYDVDDEEYVYQHFIRDSEHKSRSGTRSIEKQASDLAYVLSRPEWIDFSQSQNQLVTQFIWMPCPPEKEEEFKKFYHQLMLTWELLFRLTHRRFPAEMRKRMITDMAPSVQWSLAVVRRWQEGVRIEEFAAYPNDLKLRFINKKQQMKCLRRFARELKWPNLRTTLDEMRELDADNELTKLSEDSMAFFGGLILPGDSFPYIIMNTLSDIDPDPASTKLDNLLMDFPNCGFQYRNSYTYWSVTSIVGKVLAPTCNSIGGWVGPARPTSDLDRTQIARLAVTRPKKRIRARDIEDMRTGSNPLGPEAEEYAIDEYILPQPNQQDMVDTVRIEQIQLEKQSDREHKAASSAAVGMLLPENGNSSSSSSSHAVARPMTAKEGAAGAVSGTGASTTNDCTLEWYNALVIFAIDGMSWPLRLQFDVSFIAAWPCADGPHPLFIDYAFERVSVDKIVRIQNWGNVYRGSQQYRTASVVNDDGDDMKVLLVEAFGVKDNEVLARAWCAHWGLSAVVADVASTCISCATREAYAAAVTVVILIDSALYEEDEEN